MHQTSKMRILLLFLIFLSAGSGLKLCVNNKTSADKIKLQRNVVQSCIADCLDLYQPDAPKINKRCNYVETDNVASAVCEENFTPIRKDKIIVCEYLLEKDQIEFSKDVFQPCNFITYSFVKFNKQSGRLADYVLGAKGAGMLVMAINSDDHLGERGCGKMPFLRMVAEALKGGDCFLTPCC